MPRKRPADPDAARRILQAAMDLAAEQGWRDLPLETVAGRAGVPLADLLRRFPSRQDILAGLAEAADAAMLDEEGDADRGEPPRDRVFDRIMRRFDALLPFRPGLRRVAEELPRDPLALLPVLPRLSRSMAWTLEAAGIPAGGLRGLLAVKALSVVYLRAMRVWFTDDSADLSRTMASVDAQLRRLEEMSPLLRPRARGGAGPAAESSASG